MNQVQPDEQLCLSARQRADRVRVPDFLKECCSHEMFMTNRVGAVQPIEYTYASISRVRLAGAGHRHCCAGSRLSLRGQADDTRLQILQNVGLSGDRRGAGSGRQSHARRRPRRQRAHRAARELSATTASAPSGTRYRAGQVIVKFRDDAVDAAPARGSARWPPQRRRSRPTPVVRRTSTSCGSIRRRTRRRRPARCAAARKCEYAQAAHRLHTHAGAQRSVYGTRSGTCR